MVALDTAVTLAPDPTWPITIRPNVLFKISGVRTNDYVQTSNNVFLVPEHQPNAHWHKIMMDTEACATGHYSRDQGGRDDPESRDSRYSTIPWNHHSLVVLRDNAPATGTLSDVWAKIAATIDNGKRVVLILQGPPKNHKGCRTQQFFHDKQGVYFARFPPGTIPFGHPADGLTTSKHGIATATRGHF